jgi:hypothetical protein
MPILRFLIERQGIPLYYGALVKMGWRIALDCNYRLPYDTMVVRRGTHLRNVITTIVFSRKV